LPRETASSCGGRADWVPGTGTELWDVVERLPLKAPEADALALELASFVHAVRGERDTVVTGAEGRAALALALAGDRRHLGSSRSTGGMKAGAAAENLRVGGRASGDAHAAAVVRAMRRRWPEATIDAFGGPALQAAGATVRFPMEAYTVIGFFEVLAKIPAHLRLLRELDRDFRAGRYDLVLPVDYPGFNVRLAEAAKKSGVRSLYYVAPQLWAWRPGRARGFAAAVDGVAVILPFEPEFFSKVGIHAEFVGHPLVEQPRPRTGDRPKRARPRCRGARGGGVSRKPGPGSRPALAPLSRDHRTASRERRSDARAHRGNQRLPVSRERGRHGRARQRVAGPRSGRRRAGEIGNDDTRSGARGYADGGVVPGASDHRGDRAPRDDGAMDQPGEPGRGRAVVPEIVQWHATPEALAAALAPLFERDGSAATTQRAGLAVVRERLGGPGAADRVVAMAEEVLAA
jgi:lipid-A-disaccharide synthase